MELIQAGYQNFIDITVSCKIDRKASKQNLEKGKTTNRNSQQPNSSYFAALQNANQAGNHF